MKIDQAKLDVIATILGAIIGICTVLVSNDVIPPKVGGTIGGISTVLFGIITQKPTVSNLNNLEIKNKQNENTH